MKKVTIKDIAVEAGCSIATVSLALNNSSKVIESTKKKVQDVAINLGYIRNNAAANLRKKEQNIIHIFIHNHNTNIMWGYEKIHTGLIAFLQKENYVISSHVYSSKDIYERLRLVEAIGGAAIIIFPPMNKNLFIPEKRIPIINLSCFPKYSSDSYVCPNYNMMANMSLEILENLNHRHICIVNDTSSIPIKILNSMFKNKILGNKKIESVVWIESDLYLLDEKIKTLLQASPQITAFIFTSSESLILTASIFKYLDFIEGISIPTNSGKKEWVLCNIFDKSKPLLDGVNEVFFDEKLFIEEIIKLITFKKTNNVAQSLYLSPKVIKHKG
ncbi:LacI family DNA-binding transcriptional regulator [Aliivibrio fischeri]|uniref:LacI family DNA-binding transcriptional regulator n=1 Tax=Aliivibrio fischeri TaxID=668 RepID=UPI0012D9A97E|nr:LacI family DNA-binding transcriptional regulator [Aliivibrio fischeri]MUJ27934.1 LacI family DNA-binding transcriptional regulator [Aliivibrio fischeri]MUK76611.1 LacI family DNA-binding transcriptional regulator [Aliivibrio fischeri]